MENIKKLNIVYFGTPSISSYVLERLILEGYNIIGVVTQIDKPFGRKAILTPSPVKEVALKYNIPVYQPIKLKEDYSFLSNLKIDIILTLAYGQLVPSEVLNMPKYGCFNLHGSLLPKYRGASPIQYSLLNGDKETGITLMEMIDKMDAGRIFYQEKVVIEDSDNYTSLTNKLKECAYNAFVIGIESVINGFNNGIKQDEDEVTFTKKIKKEDEILDFNKDYKEVFNKIRGLSYEPGGYFIFNNEKIKILKASISNMVGNPSTVLKYDKHDFIIGCINGSIKVEEIQRSGKKIMSYKDFYNGNMNTFKVNDKLND